MSKDNAPTSDNNSDSNSHNNDSKDDNKPAWKKWAIRIITAFFFILVPVLLYTLIKNLEWQEVKDAITGYSITTLLIGAAIALTSYAVFASYDLIARSYTEHKLPARQIMPLAFVCYAFNLNLSAWVGSFAVRFRLYSRLGLDAATITRIVSVNIITNWLGYIILAGGIFSLRLLDLPDEWNVGATALQFIGFALLLVASAYLLACQFSKKRSWTFFKQEINLPSAHMALLQAGLGALNWSLMGLLVFILMPEEASYTTILGILLICSIAGVVTHIPAGLGVIEAVFIAMLQHQFSQGQIIAALLAYRALYFLMPLAIACVTYLVLERQAKKQKDSSNNDEQDSAAEPQQV